MNAVDMAKMAYGSSTVPLRTPRGIEYNLFVRITRHLKTAAQETPESFADLVAAIHDNRRLWSVLAVNVADENNALPRPLRARIFYLYEFVNAHSRRVLRGEATADALIDINVAIMRGLDAEGGTA